MHGWYESGSGVDPVCFPLSRIWSFSLHFLSLGSRFPTISFESFAFCTRCMFLGLISALLLRVICVQRFLHLLFPPCLVLLLLLCCMSFWEAAVQPMEWILNAAVVGSSGLSQIRKRVHRTDFFYRVSLIGLFLLCCFFWCRYPFCHGSVGCYGSCDGYHWDSSWGSFLFHCLCLFGF